MPQCYLRQSRQHTVQNLVAHSKHNFVEAILLNSSRLCYCQKQDKCREEPWCAKEHTEGKQWLIRWHTEIRGPKMAISLNQKGDRCSLQSRNFRNPTFRIRQSIKS